MVEPDQVERILRDAIRLLGEGEYPLTALAFDELADAAPQRSGVITDAERRSRFEHGASVVRAQLGG